MVTFDLADPGAIAPAAAEILQCFGYVDILINNAGISYRGAISDTIVDVDRKVMEINYFGPVALTKGRHLRVRDVSISHKNACLSCLLICSETLPVPVHSVPSAAGVVIRFWVFGLLWVYICIVSVLGPHINISLTGAALHFCSMVPAPHWGQYFDVQTLDQKLNSL